MSRPEPLSMACLEWAATATSCAILSPENRTNAEQLGVQCGRVCTKGDARKTLVQTEAWAEFLTELRYCDEREWLRLLTRFDNLVSALKRTEERLSR